MWELLGKPPCGVRGGVARLPRKLSSNKHHRVEPGNLLAWLVFIFSRDACWPDKPRLGQSCHVQASDCAVPSSRNILPPFPTLIVLRSLAGYDIPDSVLSHLPGAEGSTAKMDGISLLTWTSCPHGEALRDKGGQGQKGHCVILGKFLRLSWPLL